MARKCDAQWFPKGKNRIMAGLAAKCHFLWSPMGGSSGPVPSATAGEDDVVSRAAWLGSEDECSGLKEEVSTKPMFGNKACICFDVISYTSRFRCSGSEGRRCLWEVSSLLLPWRWVGTVSRGDISRAADSFSILDLLQDSKTQHPAPKCPLQKPNGQHPLKTLHSYIFGVMQRKIFFKLSLPCLFPPASLGEGN